MKVKAVTIYGLKSIYEHSTPTFLSNTMSFWTYCCVFRPAFGAARTQKLVETCIICATITSTSVGPRFVSFLEHIFEHLKGPLLGLS